MNQWQALQLIQQRLHAGTCMSSTVRTVAKALRSVATRADRSPELLIDLAGYLEKEVADFDAAADVS